jgi:phage terminase large subunit-like protein
MPTNQRIAAIAGYRARLDEACAAGNEIAVERELCRTDLFYLLCVVLGRRDINHDWLFARCREVEGAPDGYLDLWPREHYKSTIITLGKTIQDILRDPEITVGIFSFTRPIAKAFLRQIKREFEANARLRALFPDIFWEVPHREAPKWSEDDGLIVRRRSNPKESTIEAWGLVDAQPTSKHFRLMIYDDVLTRDSVTNPDMIAKVTEAWETSRALDTEGGATRYIGTRWHYNDTYRAIIDRGAAIERRHLVTVDGTVDGEPVLRSREWVAQKRRDMGPYVFAAQMLLDPAADRTQGFREDWIRYWQAGAGDVGAGMNKYLLVDPANSKKEDRDYTAMGVVGLASDGNFYILDLLRDRLGLRERIDALFALHRRWQPKSVAYAQYGLMADIEAAEMRMADENYRFGIAEVGGRLSKPERIRRLIPTWEDGRWHLPETCPKTDYEGKRVDLVRAFLNDEYRAWPVAQHDDMLDMLSRIFDIEVIWPKPVLAEDRYATAAHKRPRRHSAWAA